MSKIKPQSCKISHYAGKLFAIALDAWEGGSQLEIVGEQLEGKKLESEAIPELETCAKAWKRVTAAGTETEEDLRAIPSGIK